MTQEIRKSLDELNDIMANVSANFAVWRELTNAVNRENYEEIELIYEQFFITINYSNFAMIINGLNMLFETNPKTHNLITTLKKLKACGKLCEKTVEQWNSQIKCWESTTKKIIILRSNIFSHRGEKETAKSFMKKAAISPDDIESLILNTEKLLKEITEAAVIDAPIINSYTGDQTKSSTQDVMSALKRANSQ